MVGFLSICAVSRLLQGGRRAGRRQIQLRTTAGAALEAWKYGVIAAAKD
jgi:hypothetical protein